MIYPLDQIPLLMRFGQDSMFAWWSEPNVMGSNPTSTTRNVANVTVTLYFPRVFYFIIDNKTQL